MECCNAASRTKADEVDTPQRQTIGSPSDEFPVDIPPYASPTDKDERASEVERLKVELDQLRSSSTPGTAEAAALRSELARVMEENGKLQAEIKELKGRPLLVSPEGSELAKSRNDSKAKPTSEQRVRKDSECSPEEIRELEEALMAMEFFDEQEARQSVNEDTVKHSAVTLPLILRAFVYLVALAGVVFVLVYPSMMKGDSHRRLAGGGGGHGVMTAIAYCTVGAGLLAQMVHMLRQPLLLGYILAGVLVGPVGLGLVTDHEEIQTVSELGLILLLFMIGLELDIGELAKMGKVVLVTGFFQFPICAGIHLGIFTALDNLFGLTFGSGQYAALYIAFCCGISSTMIVVKLLSEKMETDTMAGRLTIGILIFQDIWAIVMLAIQPNMANPQILGLLKTFGLMVALIAVSFVYSKYVLPAVFLKASRSVELMLIMSLAWCFFICCVAILPFVELSMELAALIAGASMATFPYNAELNGKVKYIRDFFITLYFVALGMQIPAPTFAAVAKALLICVVVLIFRWVGIFSVVHSFRGGNRLAILATVNLSEVSEFGLVLCSIGKGLGHVEEETLTIIIWTFAILAVNASYLIGYNHKIYHALDHCMRGCGRLCCGRSASKPKGEGEAGNDEDEDEEERDIIILGFHRIASALVAEFQVRCPEILKKIRVIDTNQLLATKLQAKGIAFTYGDISSADVLEHAHHGEVDLVLCTIPDTILSGVTNLRLMEVARQVWPSSHVVVTADHPDDVDRLYKAGANYVLKCVKLSAERVADMLSEHYGHASGGELKQLLEAHQARDAATTHKHEDIIGLPIFKKG